MVGQVGLEPTTSCLRGRRSNQLSYWPIIILVHPDGFEPPTLCSEDRCSNPLSYGCISEVIIPRGPILGYNKIHMEIHTNIPLKNLTTMKLGGPAKYVIEAFKTEDIVEACQKSKSENLPIFVIGDGSNVIADDNGFDGIIIKVKIPGFEIIANDLNSTTIKIGAGENWDSVVKQTVDLNLTGIEAMSAIPGTAGATPVQNVGAYGQEIADTLISLEAYDIANNKIIVMQNSDCNFKYRQSIFNTNERSKYIITSITLKLSKSPPTAPFYSSLQKYLDENNIHFYNQDIIRNAVIEIRKTKLPDPKVFANCGSFFKNVIIDSWELDELKKNYPDIMAFDMGNGKFKIPTGWLITKAGLKGQLINGVRIFENNSLVLINESANSYNDLAAARDQIIDKIQNTFRIQIEQEPIEIKA